MAPSRAPSAQLLRSLRALDLSGKPSHRALSTSCRLADQHEPYNKNPQPETVYEPRLERKLLKTGTTPIGSRRRRMAVFESAGLPFDQLPYQCFQEARSILAQDRQEKLAKIEVMRKRIATVNEKTTSNEREESFKQRQLGSMHDELEHLKILADSNDPNVKRRFEDGKGDMAKPIYRFLANRKWREYKRKILVQRITQMKVIPDVLPNCDPELDMTISWNRKVYQPGHFIESNISTVPCSLTVQSYERGSKLVTIAVVDPDVPNFETNSYSTRCHFLATNIEITPTTPKVDLAALPEEQVLVPWLAPTALKGSPYHRLSIVVLQQKDNTPIDREIALKHIKQQDFSTRALMTRHVLKPVSATLFRTQWDDHMATVLRQMKMRKESNTELKRDKVEPLPYKRRNPTTFR